MAPEPRAGTSPSLPIVQIFPAAPGSTSKITTYSTPAGIHWAQLDDEYIVFNPLSDEVHRLNPMAAMVLAELEHDPLTLTQLTDRMKALLATEVHDELCTQLYGIVIQFDELGLVLPIQATTNRA